MNAISSTATTTRQAVTTKDIGRPIAGTIQVTKISGPTPAAMRETAEAQPKPDPRSSVGYSSET